MALRDETADRLRNLTDRRLRSLVRTLSRRYPDLRQELAAQEVSGPEGAALRELAVRHLDEQARLAVATEQAAQVGTAPAVAEALAPSARMSVAVQEVGWMQNDDANHPLRAPVLDAFHRLYYDEARYRGGTWHLTTWRGVRVWKQPLDLWQYQEIVHEVRPDLIVECGTAFGGSALYLADVCEAVGHGRVLTIDIEAQDDLPVHPRIEYVQGSSVDPAVLERVRAAAEGCATVMVLLDSDHSREHVLAECRAYADVVTEGSYLVVEDTDVNGHPVYPEHGPGPMEALEQFLSENDEFRHDESRDKLLVSQNPGGWLRKGGRA